jgi:hypothetical protein
MAKRSLSKWLNILVILSILLPSGAANAFSAARIQAQASVDSAIFRTTIKVDGAARWKRLEQLQIKILIEGSDWAEVLVTEQQLETLARLRFEPNRTDGVDSLIKTAVRKTPNLALEFNGLLAQADQVAASANGSASELDRETALKAAIAGLDVEQANALATLAAVDDDADGLTNTQEQWWCTDPLNAYTREDPNKTGSGLHKDGDYVSRLLQYLYHPEQGDNRLGAPFAGWPMVPGDGHFNANCLDADHDGVPDLAELYVIGSNSNSESTAHDRYDDGQKLFGLTPPNWGYLPRAEDGGYVSANLPSFVQWPGRSLFAAAFAKPEIQIVPGTLKVTAVTQIQTDHTTSSGTAKTYGTAQTKGSSDAVANTSTWNDWQEVSVTTPLVNSYDYFQPLSSNNNNINADNTTELIALGSGCILGIAAAETGVGLVAAGLSCPAFYYKEYKYVQAVKDTFFSEPKNTDIVIPPGTKLNPENVNLDTPAVREAFKNCHIDQKGDIICDPAKPPTTNDLANKATCSVETQNSNKGNGGSIVSSNDQSQISVQHQVQVNIPFSRPIPTQTNTTGHSVGGALTTTHTEYQEYTTSETNQFSSDESWGNATAVNTAHAADLTFSFTVKNIGTDYARELGDLAFSVYIGADPDPVTTYYPANDFGGDGKLHNLLSGDANKKGPFTSQPIDLTLDQMRRVDQGEPIRVVLVNYSYGADQIFYQDALNGNITFKYPHVLSNGDEQLEAVLVPIIPNGLTPETVQSVMQHFFPAKEDGNGNLISISIPNTDSGSLRFDERAQNTISWWNIFLGGMGDDGTPLQDRVVYPNPTTPYQVMFRFEQDSDQDGYSDRSEQIYETNLNDPASHPKPEVVAGVHNVRTGNAVTSTLSLLNLGLYDANGVESTMIAPDDSITILDGIVGGSGRVRAVKQVIVGSHILQPAYTPTTWHGTAKPASTGYYTDTTDRIYTFTVNCTSPGGCGVGSGDWTISWNDGAGNNGSINLGSAYASPSPINIGAFGLKISLLSGNVVHGDTFTIKAYKPSDTFQYTINREPFTPPSVVVSYNDPQGNHRFVIPPQAMNLSAPIANLSAFSGQMFQEPSLDIVTTAPFVTGDNTTNVVVNNTTGVQLTNARVLLEMVDLEGNIVANYPITQTLSIGPNIIPLTWSTNDFKPSYDTQKDYLAEVFWTDNGANLINASARPLSSFQVDPKPDFAMSAGDTAWDFGTTPQGTVMKRTFSFSNTGQLELLTFVEAPGGINVSQTGSRQVDPADLTRYEIALNTSNMPLGVYDKTITIHTSDPAMPTRTVHVTGTVTDGTVDTPAGSVQRPLDFTANITGSHTQGEWVEFQHNLGSEPQSLHPVKVYNQDYSTLWGMGKYATPFGGVGTASYDMFGDGRDGDLTVASGQTIIIDTTRVNVSASSGSGAAPANSTGFSVGDVVLFHQTQATANVGRWEFATISAINSPTSWTLSKPLTYTYDNTNGKAQVIKVPQYRNVTVNGGGILTAPAWDGTTGGILVMRANGAVTINGYVDMKGKGYRLGSAGQMTSDEYWGNGVEGEGYPRAPQIIANNTQRNGNGGGPGDFWPNGLSWSCGDGGAGGGGGGNGTPGENGGGTPNGGGGIGGSSVGNPELTLAFMGGGGGGGAGGGRNTCGSPGFNGANGGGIVFVFGNNINLSGVINSQGNNGDGSNNNNWDEGVGGSGAGGSVLLRGTNINVGVNTINVTGGIRSSRSNGSPNYGGAGGIGRIRLDYCETYSGITNPAPSTQKMQCYIAEQLEVDPFTTTSLNLPETFANGMTYQMQYGRKLDFASAGVQSTSLQIPSGLIATAAMDALVSSIGAGTLNLNLDIGNHGAWDWTSSSTITDSATLSSQNLAAAFNTYWSAHGAPSTGTIDVPIRVSMDKPGQALLTNLKVTSGGSKLRYLRVPANAYGTVTLNYTLSGDSGSAAVAIDVGDNGSIDATWSGTPASYPTSLTSNNLATAINAYLADKTGDVDIPIRFFVAPDHTLSLDSFSAVPADKSDAGVTNPDVSLPGTPPVEGDTVTVGVTLHNATTQDTGGLTVAFYATSPDWGDWYIGSTLVENILAGQTKLASVPWNTLGFTGSVPIKVVVDPYDRLAENSETNNQATATLTILTRPDLTLSAIALSDTEPVVGETVSLSLTERNQGQTLAGASHLKVYDGDPAKGGILICDNPINSISGGSDQPSTCNWSPSQAGLHRLFVVSDAAQVVPEFDEGNNLSWQDVYIGLAGPVQIDSGLAAQDPVYTSATGFGFVDPGANDRTVACSISSDADSRISTLRRDPGGQIEYRFDHLLPHHNYHLDLILYECDGAGRQESVSVDNSLLQGPVDLGDAKAHYLSLRLDPALYQTDQSIRVSITVPDTSGAVVAAVNLVDVDYRYADAGGSSDPQYSAANGAGWLDGTADQTYGALPYQTIRVDQDDNNLQYRYDGLNVRKHYQLHLTFWQPSGTAHLQKVQVDSIDSGQLIDTGDYQLHPLTIIVPQAAYAADGSIVVTVQRTNAVTGAILNEIALEELTLQQPLTCSELNVRPTPYFSETYGTLSFFGMPAAVGETRVEALTPRGEVVGCFLVSTEGQYGLMRIYGEDLSTQPTTPGARTGERITFRVNGSYAYATPATYWQNDHAAHNVDLVVKTLTDQSIALNPGWNLISFGGEPPTPLIRMLLGSALARTNRMIGETGLFTSSLADTFVTLKELHANQGYYLFLNGTTTLNWLVGGDPAATSTSIPLHTGWNWIGGPRSSMTVATALQSIDGHYKRVLGLEKTYDPSLPPSYSPLKDLKPGEGYLIYITDPVTLTYPTGTGDVLPGNGADTTDPVCSRLAPTPALTIMYGEVRINKTLAPVGTRVEIRTPRGELAGCALIAEPGLLALTHVYGAENESAGFREGEPLSFYVNGLRATSDAPLAWSNNREINPIHLSGDERTTYLPWVNGR